MLINIIKENDELFLIVSIDYKEYHRFKLINRISDDYRMTCMECSSYFENLLRYDPCYCDDLEYYDRINGTIHECHCFEIKYLGRTDKCNYSRNNRILLDVHYDELKVSDLNNVIERKYCSSLCPYLDNCETTKYCIKKLIFEEFT